MDILGIGPLELLFIFLIVLIVLGPQDMVKAGATLGRYLRKLMLSPTWRTIQETSRRIRYLPNTLVRQAGLEDFQKEITEGMKTPNISGFTEHAEQDRSLEAWTRLPAGEPDLDPGPSTVETPDQSPSTTEPPTESQEPS